MSTNFEKAYQAFNADNYISIDSFIKSEEGYFRNLEAELIDTDNPESLFAEKETIEKIISLYKSLSQEAKEIVTIIIDCPSDLLHIFALQDGSKRISIRKIETFIRKEWKERLIVRAVMEEILDFSLSVKWILNPSKNWKSLINLTETIQCGMK